MRLQSNGWAIVSFAQVHLSERQDVLDLYQRTLDLFHNTGIFQNHLLFGTVADRDPNDLMDGYLLVEFVHSVESNRVRGLFSKHISEDEQQDSYALGNVA